MSKDSTLVLNKTQVNLKIKRIAWEIYERNFSEKKLILVGIANSGFWLASRVKTELEQISTLEITLAEMALHKKNPRETSITTSIDLAKLDNQNVVLIDDVLNSGKVLVYGIRHLLQRPINQLTTAVLVDRNHKRYPVKADVKGLSLSTSLSEHVDVVITDTSAEVFLRA